MSEDQMIDVWKVSDGRSHYYTDKEGDAQTEQDEAKACGGEVFVTKEQMSKAAFDTLPEFMGF